MCVCIYRYLSYIKQLGAKCLPYGFFRQLGTYLAPKSVAPSSRTQLVDKVSGRPALKSAAQLADPTCEPSSWTRCVVG